MRWIYFLIASAQVVCCHAAFAERDSVWRWTDESGAVHITSRREDVPAKYRSFSVPMKYSTVAEPAPEPAAPKPAPLEKERVVRFDPSGGMVAVQALIGETVERGAWIDTGSELTVITTKLALALGVDVKGAERRGFHTQNGRVSAPVVMLKSVKVGPAKASDVMAAIMDFPGRGPVSVIVGMNFLSLFRFEINMREGVVIFGDGADDTLIESGQTSSSAPLKRDDAR
ncbi:MAG: clan AA aspartic protease [Nitrospinae bacterium]|nr:clan AA aspartic protease [Nitrospinota bacterium]MBF0633995.1 clan AA aspartic protease [Nitrospinota bacterium]